MKKRVVPAKEGSRKDEELKNDQDSVSAKRQKTEMLEIVSLRRQGPDLVIGYTSEQEAAHTAEFRACHPEVWFYRKPRLPLAPTSMSAATRPAGPAESSAPVEEVQAKTLEEAIHLDTTEGVDCAEYTNGIDWSGLNHVQNCLRLRTEHVTKVYWFSDLGLARGLTPEQQAAMTHSETFLARACRYVGRHVKQFDSTAALYIEDHEADAALPGDVVDEPV